MNTLWFFNKCIFKYFIVASQSLLLLMNATLMVQRKDRWTVDMNYFYVLLSLLMKIHVIEILILFIWYKIGNHRFVHIDFLSLSPVNTYQLLHAVVLFIFVASTGFCWYCRWRHIAIGYRTRRICWHRHCDSYFNTSYLVLKKNIFQNKYSHVVMLLLDNLFSLICNEVYRNKTHHYKYNINENQVYLYLFICPDTIILLSTELNIQ